MSFEDKIAEHARRTARAKAMGGPEKLARRAAEGLLNARERLAMLADPGSFSEIGLFAVSARPEDRERSPADGVVSGYARIDGREVALAASDLTVLGASSARVASQKIAHLRNSAIRNGMPFLLLGECAGARMPDAQGAAGMGGIGLGYGFNRRRETPWITAILGPSFGLSTWFAVQSDFVVMRKGAALAVSSPKVTAVAISEEIDPEELAGWRLQSEVTGLVDQVTETDEEALAVIRRLLAYLPGHAGELPPEAPERAPARPAEEILALLPESRGKVYDARKVLECIFDAGSLFPFKERFGRSIFTGLARLAGRSIGVIACNPLFKGGALDADACDKAASFIVFCDSYNIPFVQFADTPGFLIGQAGERQRVGGKIMNYVQALELASVPKLAVIMRKSYGQAYLNLGGGLSDEIAAWFTSEIGFVDPAVGVSVVHNLRREQDPARYDELARAMARDNSPYDLAGIFAAQTVIDPRETRDWLQRMLEVHRRRPGGGIGNHRLSVWPTTL
ncbi:MAG: methylmalonyl-CoA carboxyltransferase [Alphaproteobacteria bacterium]|nr:methylmalonyl-CoA carboxyltransferase [Alphaproteobacteria bacterium]